MFGEIGEVDVGASSILFGDEGAAQGAVEQLAAKFAGRGDVARAAAEVADECRRDLGEYGPARRLYEKLLAGYPESTQAMRAQRGIVNIDIKTGNYEAAEAGVETLLGKYPNHDGLPQAFCWLGNDYLDARQDEKAIQCYQYVIDNSPDSNAAMSSWAGIARVHIRRGEDQAAQNVIDKIIADFDDYPGLPQAVFRIGEEYWNEAFRFEKEELKEGAKESFRKATGVWERIITQLQPSTFTAQAYYFSGTAYRHVGDYEKAIEYYEKTVADWADYEYAWLSLLRVARTYDHLKRSGAIPAAEADGKIRSTYERILQEYPKSAAAIDARRSLSHR